MNKIVNTHLQVPIQLIEYAYDQKLVKALAILLYLKFYSSGKIHEGDDVFSHLRISLKLKDKRTFSKHISELIKRNWLGYDAKSGIYFVRSFSLIRCIDDINRRQAVLMRPEDLENFQVFSAAVLICKEVNDQKYYWGFVKKKGGSLKATSNWAVAKHSSATLHKPKKQKDETFQAITTHNPSNRPRYFGVSNEKIAKLLGCKLTRACNLKLKAQKFGYLAVKHKYLDLMELPEADFKFRDRIYQTHPNLVGRIRFFSKKVGSQNLIKAVIQLHDEIIPLVKFHRLAKISDIRQPVAVVQGFHLRCAIKKAA